MKAATKHKPYNVEEIKFTDFFDLKKFRNYSLKNRSKNSEDVSVNWLNIRWLRFVKNIPNKIFYKIDFTQTDISVLDQKGKKTRGRQIKSSKSSTAGECSLTNAYSKQFHISIAKMDDLMSLCESGIIQSAYRTSFKDCHPAKIC